MSHQVTITKTIDTTDTTGKARFINTGYLRTFPGLLKLAQLILGIACVCLVGHNMIPSHNQNPELFFLLVSVSFLIGTSCLLISCLISLTTAFMISKTIYEVIYHGLAFALYLAAGLNLLIEVYKQKSSYGNDFELYRAAAVMGLVIAVLYSLSTILAYRSYRAA